MTRTDDGPGADVGSGHWAPGETYGLRVPGDPAALLAGGPAWLTSAFRASGALAADNSVVAVVGWEEVDRGGTGRKMRLDVTYAQPAPELPESLFVKFSRNYENELWDSARHLIDSEVAFAQLSRAPDFPVRVPLLLFADLERSTWTGVLVTECIPYGRDGVEPLHHKCLDHEMPDQLGHYEAIVRGLARLSGAHKAGRLPEVDRRFPYRGPHGSRGFGGEVPLPKVLERAGRLFAFVDRCPQLFPDHVRTAAFREQFLRDLPDVVAARDEITRVLHGNPDLIAFAHWNANIDNCWFTRDPDGTLQCGFIDWANVGQLNVAQSVSGAVSGAEIEIWDEHLEDLLALYADEYAAHGGPRVAVEELRRHILLTTASGVQWSMGAPLALAREIDDVDALRDYRDSRLRDAENARIQLHMTRSMLNNWQTRRIGDVVRSL